MADLRIDSDKAERILALILREEGKMLPDRANALAAQMSKRLISAMAMPTKPALNGWRMIPPRHPYKSDFEQQVAMKFKRAGLANEIWELVYACGRDMPDDIVV